MYRQLSVGGAILFGVVACMLSGCAEPTLNERAVREAVVERETASARLVKALAGYCAARFETLEGRLDCLASRYSRGSSLRAKEGRETRSSPSRYARMFTCEHHRAETTCLRAARPLHEALSASPADPLSEGHRRQ